MRSLLTALLLKHSKKARGRDFAEWDDLGRGISQEDGLQGLLVELLLSLVESLLSLHTRTLWGHSSEGAWVLQDVGAEVTAPRTMLHVSCRKTLGRPPIPCQLLGWRRLWAEERRGLLV